MMRRSFRRAMWSAALAAAAAGAWCRPAAGVVEAKVSVAKTYADAAAVVVGRIDKSQPDAGRYIVTVTETLAGKPIGDRFSLVARSPELRGLLSDGGTVIAMPNGKDARIIILHAGDAWLLAAPGETPKQFQILARADTLVHTYPGGTAALLAMYRQVKVGKPTELLNKADPRVLTGGVRELGKLPTADVRAVTAGHAADGKTLTLAVATALGVKVFAYDGKAFAPTDAAAPAGFPPAEGAGPAGAADTEAAKAAGPVLASVAGDFAEEPGGSASLVVRAKGIFREGPAGEGKAGDGKAAAAPPADFRRLTGDPVTTYPLGFDAGVASAAAVAIDVNGDGRKDVVVLTERSGVVLVNRGRGAFFVVPNLPKLLAADDKPLPFKLGPGVRLAAADLDGDRREELIVAEPDGKVWAVGNPPPAKE